MAYRTKPTQPQTSVDTAIPADAGTFVDEYTDLRDDAESFDRRNYNAWLDRHGYGDDVPLGLKPCHWCGAPLTQELRLPGEPDWFCDEHCRFDFGRALRVLR